MPKAATNNLPVTTQPKDITSDGREDPREDVFISLLAKYREPRDAALEAGYSKSYAKNIMTYKRNNPNFINKLKARYNGQASALLPAIFEAEHRAVWHVIDNPEDLPKFRHTLKEIKQTAGVLSPDITTQTPTVSIGSVKNLMLQIHERKGQDSE